MPEDLPRRPFHELPAPEGGLDAARSAGLRSRRRRQAAVAATLSAVLVAAVVVVADAGGASPASERLTTRRTPTPTMTSGVPTPSATPSPERATAQPTTTATATVGVPTQPSASTASTSTSSGYRSPALRRSYQPGDPLGARVCTPDESNGRTRAGWCLEATAKATEAGHDLALTLCRDQTTASQLTFGDGLESDFVVRRGTTEVWRWSAHADTRGAAHVLNVERSACWVWTAPWTDVDGNGRPLPGGDYSLTVLSAAHELAGINDETTPFRI